MVLLKWQRFAASAVGLALVTLIGWQSGALLVRQLTVGPQTLQLSHQAVERWLLAGQRPVAAPDILADDRLFKVPEKKPIPVAAPRTPLKMVLSAVFVAPESNDSGAIIATLERKARYYKVGDIVAEGVTLSAVHENHVVLNRQGRSESLYFKDAAKPVSGVSSSVPAAKQTSSASGSANPVVPTTAGKPAVQNLPQTELGSDIRRLNAAAFMRKYQKKLQQNPDALLNRAGISQAPGGGYQIGKSPYASLLTSAGLEIGDVILSVNGRTLGDPQSDAGLLGNLSQQKEVEVLIKRGSRQFAVTFPVTR